MTCEEELKLLQDPLNWITSIDERPKPLVDTYNDFNTIKQYIIRNNPNERDLTYLDKLCLVIELAIYVVRKSIFENSIQKTKLLWEQSKPISTAVLTLEDAYKALKRLDVINPIIFQKYYLHHT